MSSRLAIFLKSIVAAALLGFLLWKMDLSKLKEVFSSANWILVLVSGLIHFGTVGFSTNRWRVILANFSILVRFGLALKLLIIGYFFNLFLPSSFGGDFVRAFYLGKESGRGMSTTLMTTMLDRAAGLTALLLIGMFSVLVYPIEVEGFSLRLLFVLICCGFGFALVVVFNSKVHRVFTGLMVRFNLKGIEEKIELVSQGMIRLRENKKAILAILAYSFAIQIAVILSMWVGALALGIEAPFSIFFVFIPVINLSVTIPLSINGIGLRESAYTLLFTQLGVPMEKAFALSLINFLVVAMTSIPGGAVYSLYKRDEDLPLS